MLLMLSLAIVLVVNVALFAVAYVRQSDKLTDFSYALSFIVVAMTAWLLAQQTSSVLLVAVGMVVVWAVRLGGFLVFRIRKTGKDTRFDGIREDFFKFLKFWLGQGVVAWFLLLPVLFLTQQQGVWNWLSIVGVVIWLSGLVLETVADAQKYAFTHDSKNKGKWIESGVWRYSRHPNYFGEICVWLGVYLMIVPSLDGAEQFIAFISPLSIFVTLRFISGVPPLESLADKRWGNNEDYQRYKKRTNLLLPFWPKR